MKVKIGDEVYDAENVPIMVMFNTQDKQTLRTIIPSRYCAYPDGMTNEEMARFMGGDSVADCKH